MSTGPANHEISELKAQNEKMAQDMQEMKRQWELQMAAMAAGGMGVVAPAVQVMTDREKRELAININKLPSDKLNRVLQIIQERMPLDSQVCGLRLPCTVWLPPARQAAHFASLLQHFLLV